MKLLILGGTRFLGRSLVEAAAARDWEITLFNRGQSGPDVFPHLETVIGDRDGGLSALDGGRWDAVVDTCGYLPRLVGDSARTLADRVGHYTFVSSISVYRDESKSGLNESSPVVVLDNPATEEITGETYGGLKALCENAVQEAVPGRGLVVRPGLIVGPHDPSDRFSYWVERVARGGRTLCPAPPHRPVQVIDVRDLASWMIDLVESRTTGIVQATGDVHAFRDTLEACPGFDSVTPVWADSAFLTDNNITPWTELPLWMPGLEESGFMRADTTRAREWGLTCRPLAGTARDTLEWLQSLPSGRERKAGLAPEKEASLLARLA